VSPVSSTEDDPEHSRFLTAARIERIATICAPLLTPDLGWVERRKEKVVLLDETALRRQVSVDFSLRRAKAQPLLPEARVDEDEAASEDALWCAPIYVVGKTHGNLMAFDLEDESHASLTLVAREDNALISAAVLIKLAKANLTRHSMELPEALRHELERLASAEAVEGQRIAARLRKGTCAEFVTEIAKLRDDPRFMWWVGTFAHSSLIVVLYRAAHPGRKMIKLRFEEPITDAPKWKNRMGWRPYRVGIDSGLIEARSFHVEVEAPTGLRITRARLTDDGAADPVASEGFLKRVHLYRPHAETAGAGTSTLWLMASGGGFIGGAALASMLTLAVVVACIIWAQNIAANPTSAPALLLVLPGVIASYVARPDHHAMTTNMLFGARAILLASAACAYVAAAKLALSGGTPKDPALIEARGDSIRKFMCFVAVPAAIAAASLALTWWLARTRFRRQDTASGGFKAEGFVCRTPEQLYHHVRSGAEPRLLDESFEQIDASEGAFLQAYRMGWSGPWVMTVNLREAGGDTTVHVDAAYLSRWPARLWRTRTIRREADIVNGRLVELERWALADD
jgi:hypothetical protein